MDIRPKHTIHNLVQHKQPLEQKLQFGSFTSDIGSSEDLLNMNAAKERESRNLNGPQLDPQVKSNSRNFDLDRRGGVGGWGKQHHGGNYRSVENRMPPPPGFSNKPRGGGNWDYESRRRELDHSVNKEKGNHSDLSKRSSEDERLRSRDASLPLGLTAQLDRPGPPAGSNLHSALASDIEESLMNDIVEDGTDINHELDDVGEELVDSLLLESESDAKKDDKKQNRNSREKVNSFLFFLLSSSLSYKVSNFV